MTLKVCDRQSEGDLDSIQNSCDVYFFFIISYFILRAPHLSLLRNGTTRYLTPNVRTAGALAVQTIYGAIGACSIYPITQHCSKSMKLPNSYYYNNIYKHIYQRVSCVQAVQARQFMGRGYLHLPLPPSWQMPLKIQIFLLGILLEGIAIPRDRRKTRPSQGSFVFGKSSYIEMRLCVSFSIVISRLL